MVGEFASKRDVERTVKQLGLVGKAAKSFIKLCELGCEARLLGEFFYTVSHNPQIQISREKVEQESYSFTLRSLDSDDTALGGLNKKQIKALQKTLMEAAETIDKLNKSSLARYIASDEMIPYREIFCLPQSIRHYSEKFIPFFLEQAKQIGAKKRPHFSLYMNFLCDEVKEKAGKESYRLICDVLNGLGIGWDVDALKQWRSRNNPNKRR